MPQKVSIIRKAQQTSSKWPGGTTTQLYIFPHNAVYSQRNFLFRISTATVDTETSAFTSLPGITRHLMVLDGILNITHENRYSKVMRPMDTDSFDGEWHTTGVGKVTDFNLMTTGACNGILKYRSLEKGRSFTEIFTTGIDMIGCYLLEGSIRAEHDMADYRMYAKDFMLVPKGKNGTLIIDTDIDAKMVFCLLSLNIQ